MTPLQEAQAHLAAMDKLVQAKQRIDYQFRKGKLTMAEYRQQANIAMAAINAHNGGPPIYFLYPEE